MENLSTLSTKLLAISSGILVSGLVLTSLQPLTADATTVWQIAGQEALTLEYPDNLARDRLARLNQRLTEIVSRLNPKQNWVVDILPVRPTNGKKTISAKPSIIRLQGQPLLEVTEADAKAHNANSSIELANIWVRSLAVVFNQAGVRQRLTATLGMPTKIGFNGVTYGVKTDIAPDRGLFRTNGDRSDGKVVYLEIPADNKAYQIRSIISNLTPSKPPSVIFLLNRNMQFVPYARPENQAVILLAPP